MKRPHFPGIKWKKVALLSGCMWAQWSAMAAQTAPSAVVTDATVLDIVAVRCEACHSAHPTLMPSAPNGLVFADIADIQKHAHSIYRQVVQLQTMPVGNVTHITDAERDTIAHWFEARANGR